MPGPSCPGRVASLPELGGTPWTACHEFPFPWYWLITSWVERNTSLKTLHLQFMGSQTVGHDWVTNAFHFHFPLYMGIQLVPFQSFRGGPVIAFLSLSTSLPLWRYGHSEQRGPLFPGVHFLLETTSLTVTTAPTSHLKVLHFLGNGCLTLEKLRTRVTSVSYSEHIHFGMIDGIAGPGLSWTSSL